MHEVKASHRPVLAATPRPAMIAAMPRLIQALRGLTLPAWLTAAVTGLAVIEAVLLRSTGHGDWPLLAAAAVATSTTGALLWRASRQRRAQQHAGEPILVDEREQSRKLEQRQRQSEALLEVIVHDMRGPVGAAVLSLEYMALELKKRQDTDELREAAADALSTLNNLSALISQVLYVAKLESCRLTLRLDVVPLRPILVDAIREAASRARSCNVTLDLDVDEHIRAAVDMRLLPRVLDVLIAYVLRRMADRGRIVLAVERSATETRLSIRSTGPAVPAADREQAFDKFPGTGPGASRQPAWAPGLYFCKLVALSHHGSLAFEDIDGWPLSFVIRLPSIPEVPQAPEGH